MVARPPGALPDYRDDDDQVFFGEIIRLSSLQMDYDTSRGVLRLCSGRGWAPAQSPPSAQPGGRARGLTVIRYYNFEHSSSSVSQGTFFAQP